MKPLNHQPTSTFSYTCRICGFKFTSNKNPQKISLFEKSNPKIVNHQVESQKLNLKCPNCGGRDLNIDWGKCYNSSDDEKLQNIPVSEIPVTTRQKISVSVIEKIIDILSFVVGKITKSDKKNNMEQHPCEDKKL